MSFNVMRGKVNTNVPELALNIRWDSPIKRFEWAAEHGLALEYTPDPAGLKLLEEQLRPFTSASIPVRFHGYFPGYELGSPDNEGTPLRTHVEALRAIHGVSHPFITVHINLNPNEKIDEVTARDNLSRLVEQADQMGITVSLENLRCGFTSHPENVLALAEASGSMITLDVGHAVSCERVKSGELTPVDFVDAFESRLCEVHIYGWEADRHYPINDIEPMKPLLRRLLTTQCHWWTIELEDYSEALSTQSLLTGYFNQIKEQSC
jgi:hypothetical protein